LQYVYKISIADREYKFSWSSTNNLKDYLVKEIEISKKHIKELQTVLEWYKSDQSNTNESLAVQNELLETMTMESEKIYTYNIIIKKILKKEFTRE